MSLSSGPYWILMGITTPTPFHLKQEDSKIDLSPPSTWSRRFLYLMRVCLWCFPRLEEFPFSSLFEEQSELTLKTPVFWGAPGSWAARLSMLLAKLVNMLCAWIYIGSNGLWLNVRMWMDHRMRTNQEKTVKTEGEGEKAHPSFPICSEKLPKLSNLQWLCCPLPTSAVMGWE